MATQLSKVDNHRIQADTAKLYVKYGAVQLCKTFCLYKSVDRLCIQTDLDMESVYLSRQIVLRSKTAPYYTIFYIYDFVV